MHPSPLLAASAITLTLVAAAASPAAAETTWHTRYEDAVAAARESGKPILADFTGSDWCGWCMKLEAEVFETEAFAAWAGEHVVLLELDFPRRKPQSEALQRQNRGLAERFGIRGFPTILFLDADGHELGRSGYKPGGAEAWTADAEAILAAAAQPAAEKSPWGTDYEAAVRQAKESGKLILVDFTGSDWCHWCKKLKAEVFEQPEFKKWAREHVILLELDFPRRKPQDEALKRQNERLLQKYSVEGFPTILFLDAEGNQVGKLGYQRGGPGPWTEAAQAILDAHHD